MRIYVTNHDSKEIFPRNSPSSFKVQLPQHLEGSWECAALYCNLPEKPNVPVFVIGDFIESSSIVGARFLPALCMVTTKSKEYTNIDYLQVKSTQVQTLDLTFVNAAGERVQLSGDTTVILLDFKPKWRP